MLAKRAFQRYFVVVAVAFLVFNAIVKIAAYAVIQQKLDLNRGAPGLSLNTGDAEEVLLELDSWTRYTLFSPQQWQPLFPEGGIVHLGPQGQPFTVAMMHQLRCLDVVRDQLTRTKAERDEEPTRHCMNYLRQTVQCRGDLHMDGYQYPHKVNPVHPHPIRRCKDWRVVYDKVAEYQRLGSA
ncbi:hypothetical protein L226DRAFT_493490 [Lentinus tigrinus ALCF2SS1-7]|uniref:Uncharacterized protein n=1 Tax=Lentinus tigrinus ALCF2SS1-6 TaxID=1328759 RepID=A0A5C2RV77_9APHY|nr:hypothetical protein L227DRAFT_534467 [Lentinus tigrinus ALCF2SS1-6]RPD70029.1 hypothetical protein L226DRAFT_493490 [Lentinus tigrinus ALCF2SS1-7]